MISPRERSSAGSRAAPKSAPAPWVIRSILADPRDAEMKDRLNSRVKQRAWFRPFAPAILEERMSKFFEIDQLDPFMTMAPKVRAGKAHLIPAAVHFDGTARLQTVAAARTLSSTRSSRNLPGSPACRWC